MHQLFRMPVHRPLVFAIRWLTLWALWLLLVNSTDHREMLIGAIAATATVIMVTLWTRKEQLGFAPEPAWMALAFKVPGSVMSDSFLVLKLVLAKLHGAQSESLFTTVRFATSDTEEAREITRRTLATAYVSTSPNSIVVHVDRSKQRLLLHEMKAVPVPDIIRSLEQ